MTPLTHSRSSSMSGDDSFELEIQVKFIVENGKRNKLKIFIFFITLTVISKKLIDILKIYNIDS